MEYLEKTLGDINAQYHASIKEIDDKYEAEKKLREEKLAQDLKAIDRKFYRGLVLGVMGVLVVAALITCAILDTHRTVNECQARKGCPSPEVPAYIQGKCLCVRLATP